MSGQTMQSSEVERLGTALLRDRILPNLDASENGKYIAVSVTTGDYEINESDVAAVLRLRARHGEDSVWLARVGEKYAAKIGLR